MPAKLIVCSARCPTCSADRLMQSLGLALTALAFWDYCPLLKRIQEQKIAAHARLQRSVFIFKVRTSNSLKPELCVVCFNS